MNKMARRWLHESVGLGSVTTAGTTNQAVHLFGVGKLVNRGRPILKIADVKAYSSKMADVWLKAFVGANYHALVSCCRAGDL